MSCLPIAALRPMSRSSRQPAKETAMTSGAPRRTAESRACVHPASTPACRIELLPTPLGPYRRVSQDAMRFAVITSRSNSRPKNSLSDSL
jgi:hypothetical protein